MRLRRFSTEKDVLYTGLHGCEIWAVIFHSMEKVSGASSILMDENKLEDAHHRFNPLSNSLHLI
jgi:hypothetical protein